MSILSWVVLGLIAGFIGSKLVNKTGEGLVLDITLGIVGARERAGETAAILKLLDLSVVLTAGRTDVARAGTPFAWP